MKRKVLCSILAILIILASIPMTAFAADGEKTITNISLTATRDLIQYFDGWYNEEEVTPYFYYNVFDGARPNMVVSYSDGTSENISYEDFHEYFWSTNVVTLQSVATEFGVGTHTAEIMIYYGAEGEKSITTEIDFAIIENPVESISVTANKDFVENISGSYEDKYDAEGNVSGQYFSYHYELADIEIVVNYKNSESKTYTYSGNYETNLFDVTGYELCFNGDQADKPFVLGENTMEVSYLGVKGTVTFNVVADPIKKITLAPTKSLVFEGTGDWEYIDSEDESKGKWFCYYLNETDPIVTVEYTDGSITVCDAESCYDEFGEYIDFASEQAYENQYVMGQNTATVTLMGRECELVFEIVPNPISSISLHLNRSLQENKDSTAATYIDENGEAKEYQLYVLPEDIGYLTINYVDPEKESETYPLNELSEVYGDSPEISLGQNEGENLEPGKHKGTVYFLGVFAEFEYEIIPDPIKSISVKATRPLVEKKDGCINGESTGEHYFHYDIYSTVPEITITYSDGSVKVYSYDDLSNHDIYVGLYANQDSENQLKVGTNTAYLRYGARIYEFTFEIVENPIRKIEAKPTKDLVEFTNGYVDAEDGCFVYYVEDTFPNITIYYKDGTTKTYDYLELIRFTDYQFYIDDYQGEERFSLGENTCKIQIDGFTFDYKFNIVAQNDSQKVISLKVTPEQKLVENHCGWFDYEYSEEEGYFYYNLEDITFTATIKYADGTEKTYKNLSTHDIIDGSDFDVNTYQSKSIPFELGKNKAIATYRNASCEFEVEVVENNYTALEISGENELVLTFTKADGTKETHKANNFAVEAMFDEIAYGYLVTEKGQIFEFGVKYTTSADGKSIKNINAITFFSDDENMLQSNVISSNNWLEVALRIPGFAAGAGLYSDGYSQRYYGSEFTGFSGVITGSKVDDVLSVCTISKYYLDYENSGVDEKGEYAILTLEEAKALVSENFDVSKIDFTSSPMYNAGPKEIKVYFIGGMNGSEKNTVIKYENDSYVISYVYENIYTGITQPVTVKCDKNGCVISLSIGNAKCGTIKTINAKNADGGVQVTFTESENALEYEIYRSLNGGKFEKIATTFELSYLDKTVASGKTYTYKVRAINSTSQGEFSTTKTIVYVATPTFTISQSNAGFSVKWGKVEGATSYIVYRADFVNGKWSAWKVIATPKASVSSYSDKTVTAGEIYKYTVRAVSDNTKSSFVGSNAMVFLKTPTIKIENAKDGIKGTWSQVAGAQGYAIYRSELVNGKWTSWYGLGTADSTDKSFTDRTVISGKTYRYTVRAVADVSKSQYVASNRVLYITEPTVKVANAKNGITVNWTKSGGATGYTVYRSQYNGTTKKWTSWKIMGTAKADKFAWTDKSATSGVTYRYTVRAVLNDSRSSYTATSGIVRLAQPTVKLTTIKTNVGNVNVGVKVSWNKIDKATGYAVYRSYLVNDKWSSWENIDNTNSNQTSCTDKSVVSGKTYRYTVRARSGSTLSSFVASSQLMLLNEPIVKVSNYSTGVKVTWNKVEGAQGYTVYSSTYNTKTKKWSSWTARGTAKATTTSWVDKKVESGAQYRYTVRAVNGKFKSRYTATQAIVYLARPTVTVAKSTNGVSVTWTKSAGATSYVVYRQTSVDGTWSAWQAVGTTKSTVNKFADKTAAAGTTYRYTVRAVRGNVKSAYTASSQIAY